MNTFVKTSKTVDGQKIATFSGEGAYHGSSKTKETPSESEEMKPTTLAQYVQQTTFGSFDATFPNLYQVERLLPVPSQEEIQNDAVTFVWCSFEQALEEAGPVTKTVLQGMESLLERNKKYIYVDSKIQYFQKNDLPVDSKLWHIDGSIAIRDHRALDLGYTLLHDMRARMLGPAIPARYLAYQSSHHCATQFATEPVSITVPDFIPSFDILDQLVQEAKPVCQSQPAGSIVRFDGLSLHRAVHAQSDGWRLWIRCVETDHEIKLNSSIINCYGTVFRQN